MPKTRELTIDCESLNINPASYKMIRVTIEGPDVADIFNSIDEDDLIQYVKDNIKLEDIYPEDTLEDWAERNGYTKNENN